MSNEEPSEDTPDTTLAATGDELFGKWGHRLRNFCGTLSVIAVCVASLIYAVTIHESVTGGHGWPDTITTGIMVCGPIMMGWSFMNVNKILGLLLDSTDGHRSVLTRVKDAARGFSTGPNKKDE